MREKRPTEKAVVVVGNKAYISREKATSRLLSSARSANRLAVVAPPQSPRCQGSPEPLSNRSGLSYCLHAERVRLNLQ